MARIFVKQVVGRDKQVYNIHKVVNSLGQVFYEAEATKPYGVNKRAVTEQELTNILNREVESAYTVKSTKTGNEKLNVR